MGEGGKWEKGRNTGQLFHIGLPTSRNGITFSPSLLSSYRSSLLSRTILNYGLRIGRKTTATSRLGVARSQGGRGLTQTPGRGSCNFDGKKGPAWGEKLQQTSELPLNRITEASVRSGRGSGTMTPVRGTRITKNRVLASYFSSLQHSGSDRTLYPLESGVLRENVRQSFPKSFQIFPYLEFLEPSLASFKRNVWNRSDGNHKITTILN